MYQTVRGTQLIVVVFYFDSIQKFGEWHMMLPRNEILRAFILNESRVSSFCILNTGLLGEYSGLKMPE